MQLTRENIFTKHVIVYTLIGVLFGLLFPIFSTYYMINANLLPLSWESVIKVKKNQPLLWVIDTAPIFLGIFAAMVGINKQPFYAPKIVNFKKHIVIYTIYGALFGTLFPMLALHYTLSNNDLNFSIQNIKVILSAQPLLWIIMTAPFFLGVFAAIGGINKKQGEELKELAKTLKLNQSRLQMHAQSLREVAQYDEVVNVDLRNAFPKILKTIVRTMRVEQAGLWQIENEGNNVYLQCLAFCSDDYCIAGNHIERKELNKSDIFEYLSKTIKTHDMKHPTIKLLYDFEYNKHIVNRACISAPVKDEKNVIGVLTCATADPSRKWLDDEAHYFEVMANFISLLILAKEKESAKEADRKKLAFLSVMGHELRTPLNIISGFSDLLVNNAKDKTTKEYAREVQNATGLLNNLVNDLLQLCKLENKNVTLQNSPFKLSEFIEKLSESYIEQASQKGLKFHIKIDEEVPEVVVTDETKLKQMLANCLDNAIKFTKEGSVKLHVSVNKAREKTMGMIPLNFSISDTGIGIDKNKFNNIFDSFTQIDSSIAREYEGTGLGLAISKHIAELMRGEINVKSTVGEGTTFNICIPITTYRRNKKI